MTDEVLCGTLPPAAGTPLDEAVQAACGNPFAPRPRERLAADLRPGDPDLADWVADPATGPELVRACWRLAVGSGEGPNLFFLMAAWYGFVLPTADSRRHVTRPRAVAALRKLMPTVAAGVAGGGAVARGRAAVEEALGGYLEEAHAAQAAAAAEQGWFQVSIPADDGQPGPVE